MERPGWRRVICPRCETAESVPERAVSQAHLVVECRACKHLFEVQDAE